MKPWAWIVSVSLVTTQCFAVDESSDQFSSRHRYWTQRLESSKFDLREDEVGVLYSLTQYSGDCKVHIIYDPNDRRRLSFRFERDGKELLALHGQTYSAFRTYGKTLFFVHYHRSVPGCQIVAYDLSSGNQQWETRLDVVSPGQNFAYFNVVSLGLISETGGNGVLSVLGKESNGEYIAMLDMATGKLLAQKIFRLGNK